MNLKRSMEDRAIRLYFIFMDYKSKRWERKRAAILRRDEYLCQECKRYGKSTPAQTVHHINPVEERLALAFVDANLISLCNQCHNKMHDRTTGALTAKGEWWREKVSPLLTLVN